MIGFLLAAALVPYPTPPTTEPPPVLAGECELVGASNIPPDADNVISDDDTLTLIVKCGISDETTRLFEIHLSGSELVEWRLILETFDDEPDDDKPVVH